MPFSLDAATLLHEYGYIAIAIGAFLEGETIVLIAGFLAHQGYLHAPYAALAAFFGSTASDQIIFSLAHYKGDWLLQRFPRLKNAVETLAEKMRGRETLLILTFRFIYGVRNAAPAFLGLSGVSPRLFIPLNILSAAAWASAFVAAGYYFGAGLSTVLGRIREYEPYILLGLVAAACGAWFYRRKKNHKAKNNATAVSGKSETADAKRHRLP